MANIDLSAIEPVTRGFANSGINASMRKAITKVLAVDPQVSLSEIIAGTNEILGEAKYDIADIDAMKKFKAVQLYNLRNKKYIKLLGKYNGEEIYAKGEKFVPVE